MKVWRKARKVNQVRAYGHNRFSIFGRALRFWRDSLGIKR